MAKSKIKKTQPIQNLIPTRPCYLRLTEQEFVDLSMIAVKQGIRFAHLMRILAVKEIERAKAEKVI